MKKMSLLEKFKKNPIRFAETYAINLEEMSTKIASSSAYLRNEDKVFLYKPGLREFILEGDSISSSTAYLKMLKSGHNFQAMYFPYYPAEQDIEKLKCSFPRHPNSEGPFFAFTGSMQGCSVVCVVKEDLIEVFHSSSGCVNLNKKALEVADKNWQLGRIRDCGTGYRYHYTTEGIVIRIDIGGTSGMADVFHAKGSYSQGNGEKINGCNFLYYQPFGHSGQGGWVIVTQHQVRKMGRDSKAVIEIDRDLGKKGVEILNIESVVGQIIGTCGHLDLAPAQHSWIQGKAPVGSQARRSSGDPITLAKARKPQSSLS